MSDLEIRFTFNHFTPSEHGWVIATRLDSTIWDVHGLLGWADITVPALPSSFRTVVPVPVGAQGDGDLAVLYEPSERFRIHYAPHLFSLVQRGSMFLSSLELGDMLQDEVVPE